MLPAILGALADEHRLSASGIGLAATFEALSMGLSTAAAGLWLPPKRLKLIGAATSLALVVADFASMRAHFGDVMVIRTLAGVPEGILLWITIGMIARTATPERWAGIFFTALTAGQLAIALLFALWVMPAYGADGGFAGLALASLAGIAVAFALPSSYAPLADGAESSGMPPPRGWFALFATLIYIGAASTVGVYLQPLAQEAGLSRRRRAQRDLDFAGGTDRWRRDRHRGCRPHPLFHDVRDLDRRRALRPGPVFLGSPPAWLFIAANALAGFRQHRRCGLPGTDDHRIRSVAPRRRVERQHPGAGRRAWSLRDVIRRRRQRCARRHNARRRFARRRSCADRRASFFFHTEQSPCLIVHAIRARCAQRRRAWLARRRQRKKSVKKKAKKVVRKAKRVVKKTARKAATRKAPNAKRLPQDSRPQDGESGQTAGPEEDRAR